MGIFGNLFRKGEEPNKTWADPILGQTEWSDDDEAWCGEFEGFRFSISYEWTGEPDPALVEYAREILRSREWLLDTLIREKITAKTLYGDDLSSEIDRLEYGTIHFMLQKKERVIVAGLGEDGDGRAWRIEFMERSCSGIGFDS